MSDWEKNGLGFDVCQPAPSFRAELAETRNPGDDRGSWIPKQVEVKTNPEKIKRLLISYDSFYFVYLVYFVALISSVRSEKK